MVTPASQALENAILVTPHPSALSAFIGAMEMPVVMAVANDGFVVCQHWAIQDHRRVFLPIWATLYSEYPEECADEATIRAFALRVATMLWHHRHLAIQA